MNLYLDTEYNSFGGELISLALINSDTHWYEVTSIKSLRFDPWVAKNVIPVLGKFALRPLIFRLQFQQFIQQFKNPTIICDWHADAQHFCSLLASHDFGSSLDYECCIKILRTPPGQPVSELPHNALEDARALMKWHQSLTEEVKDA